MGRNSFWIIMILGGLVLDSCESQSQKLPFYGKHSYEQRNVDGGQVVDTQYYKIPDFAFTDQDSQQVTHETLSGYIYVADFFFISCPTICPKMKQQLLRVYDRFESKPMVKIVSHTIDPKRDTVAALKRYAGDLGVETAKWHFVTGQKDSIYQMARAYMVAVNENEEAEGGLEHSGAFLLIDGEGRIRGIYDGTDPDSVDDLMIDINILLDE